MSTNEITPAVLSVIRGEISKLRIPGAHDKVYNDECMLSFDSPFSDEGLYVNMVTLQGLGTQHFSADVARGRSRLYIHEKWTQVPKAAPAPEKADEAEAPAKLAIGTPGGFITEAQFDIIKENTLVVMTDTSPVRIALPNTALPDFVSNVAQAIIDHGGMKSKLQVDSWDASNEIIVSKYADALIQLDNGKKISQDPTTWRCEESGDTENLWLNLSTGYIGGGRRNWDGTGGSGAALKHFQETGGLYPLCVKLGTITANSADVWSYAPDEDCLVKDPLLPQHLVHWGIDIMKLEKTDKSLTEMEVELNMKYDWSRILESGEQLEAVHGPGFVGLRNIGSSCYLNSVMQTLLAVPEIQERYLTQRDDILANVPADPTTDFPAQFSKLAAGVLTDKYVPPATAAATASSGSIITVAAGEEKPSESTYEKYVVAPRMFKHLIGKDHREFSSSRQQDASEFYMHFLECMKRAEKSGLTRFDKLNPTKPTSSIFEFHVESRYQCLATGQVRYPKLGNQTLSNTLELRIPLDAAVNKAEVDLVHEHKKARISTDDDANGNGNGTGNANRASSGSGEWVVVDGETIKNTSQPEEEDPKLLIPFESCLNTFFGEEVVDFNNPSLGPGPTGTTQASRTAKLRTFPRYLMVKLGRYYPGPNWVQVKVDARVPVPEHLDLSAYRGHGLQPGEEEMPESSSSSSSSATAGAAVATATVEADEVIVSQLIDMGFSQNAGRRAALATGNSGSEAAANWCFEHMEDPDFNDPPTAVATAPGGGGGGSTGGDADPLSVSEESVVMIQSMGYTSEQAKAALLATDNNLERAMDWIFSRDDLDQAVAEVLTSSSSSSAAATGPSSNEPSSLVDDGEGKYTLLAIISHIGKNTDHGHYVCHIKKNDQWMLFNDEKVAKSKVPPLEHGFMYLFRRDDGTGTLRNTRI